jgi:hypothetical protein
VVDRASFLVDVDHARMLGSLFSMLGFQSDGRASFPVVIASLPAMLPGSRRVLP